jgi:hypothetical protein
MEADGGGTRTLLKSWIGVKDERKNETIDKWTISLIQRLGNLRSQ